jgi:hypothetical protein
VEAYSSNFSHADARKDFNESHIGRVEKAHYKGHKQAANDAATSHKNFTELEAAHAHFAKKERFPFAGGSKKRYEHLKFPRLHIGIGIGLPVLPTIDTITGLISQWHGSLFLILAASICLLCLRFALFGTCSNP